MAEPDPPDALRDFVLQVGEGLGRPAEDIEPFLDLLLEHWYDSVESLVGIGQNDLTRLGIPLRFAKELVATASAVTHSTEHGTMRPQSETTTTSLQENFAKGSIDEGQIPAKGKAKGKMKGLPGEVQQTVPFDVGDLNLGFPFRQRILGEGGCNVRHIREETGASLLWLYGIGSGSLDPITGREHDKPMHFLISCKEKVSLANAVDMANDLLKTVADEYNQWLCDGNNSSTGPWKDGAFKGRNYYDDVCGKWKGKGKSKITGEGKGRWSEEARPRKWARTG